MEIQEHTQEYGLVRITESRVHVIAPGIALYDWAHRAGAAWPCSELARLDSIRVELDANGLLDMVTSPDGVDVPSDELNAWLGDVLGDVLPKSHPAWFVNVGQFLPQTQQCRDCGATFPYDPDADYCPACVAVNEGRACPVD
jgi:hypothetical protein